MTSMPRTVAVLGTRAAERASSAPGVEPPPFALRDLRRDLDLALALGLDPAIMPVAAADADPGADIAAVIERYRRSAPPARSVNTRTGSRPRS